jgi:hypothetical protein
MRKGWAVSGQSYALIHQIARGMKERPMGGMAAKNKINMGSCKD